MYLMGSDQRIVRSARVSFNKDTFTDIERDKKLIEYLLKHKHASPFEHNIIVFKASRPEFFSLLETVDNPAIPVYYDSGLVFMTLRTAFNVWNFLNHELKEQIRSRFPTAVRIFETKDREGPYTEDKYFFLIEPITTTAGSIALVDKLELGTRMDYYTFLVECPIFVARQWMRHRFGAYNEVSRRYTSVGIDFYIPKKLRRQDKKNKQASVEDRWLSKDTELELINSISTHSYSSYRLYLKLIKNDVAKELARIVLPHNLITRFYWTVPRIALDNFITLRTHKGAQKEIREFAEVIEAMVGYKGTDKSLSL